MEPLNAIRYWHNSASTSLHERDLLLLSSPAVGRSETHKVSVSQGPSLSVIVRCCGHDVPSICMLVLM